MKLQTLLFSYLTTLNCLMCVDGRDDETSTNLQSRSSEGYPLPYVGAIKFPMYSGKEIAIEGVIQNQASYFSVKLCHTDMCDYNVPFIMLIDFIDNMRVMSSYYDFPSEGIENTGKLPFKHAQQFRIDLKITNELFTVWVDGKMTDTFKNEMPLEEIMYVQVDGQAEVNWILFSKMNPAGMEIIERRNGGEKIVIYGYPTNDTYGFSFNIKCVQDGSKNIVVHLNIRFNTRETVIDYFQKGEWAFNSIDTVYDYFDFKIREQFIVQFLTSPGSTLVKINSKFEKRLDHKMDCYDHLDFDGDVRVEKILMS
ncbi:uncharacterized protein LOC131935659 [Physella acuta]|uniref:uncharacterized protein LOC131935659 n=1 Tax=Physella acuta TaxID=109671 RepID=UPI0027DAD58D|nr:uncharacterized protein LOC131935659 [Physella acuta]